MRFFPLGKHFCYGWRWDFHLLKRRHLRGSNPGQVSGPADDRYFHLPFRRCSDVVTEAIQQTRQHVPQWPLVGSADRLVERNRRTVSNRKCPPQPGKDLG